MAPKRISRRKLLKDATYASIAGSLYLSLPTKVFGQSPSSKTKVILIRNKDVIDDAGAVNEAIMKKMLDTAVVKLTEKSTPEEAWKQLIKPDDIVGVKSNVWRHLGTPTELEDAIKSRVLEIIKDDKKISIGDRGVLHDNVFKKATALINVRPLRTHNWSGVGSLLKNYIMFDPKPYSYHDDTCADLATLWELPIIKGKTRLNILVMLTPLFHGVGPHHFNKKYTWPYKGLLVGFDPVAVDSIGVKILQAKRRGYFDEDRPINPPVKHVFLADTRHGLGIADPEKIDLIKLGWDEDLLI